MNEEMLELVGVSLQRGQALLEPEMERDSPLLGHGSDFFFFSSRRRHTSSLCDWSSDVCSSDLISGIHVRSVDDNGWSEATSEVELLFVTKPGTLPILDEPCGMDADVAKWIEAGNLDSIAQRLLVEAVAGRRQQLWNGFIECWVDKCVRVGPLQSITWQLEDADLVKVATIDSYVLLDLAYLS